MAVTKLVRVDMFAGNRIVQRFSLADHDLDPTGATPMDLDGRVVKWSLSFGSGTSYSSEPVVDKRSDSSTEISNECFELTGATVNDGGTGYAVGDVLALVGGVGFAAAVTVTAITVGGVVSGVSILQPGCYSTPPTSATVAAIGGNGTCELNTTFALIRGEVLVTMVEEDTEDRSGVFHQELEVFDGLGGSLVVAVGDVNIARNVRNA